MLPRLHAGRYPFYTYQQATQLLSELSAMNGIPWKVVSACSHKVARGLLHALQRGVFPDALRVIGAFVRDLSPKGIHQASRNGTLFKLASSFPDVPPERLYHKSMQCHGYWIERGWYGEHEGIRVERRIGTEIGSWFIFPNGPTPATNHQAFMVRVGDPQNGQLRWAVLDPGLDPIHPLWIDDWKRKFEYANPILMSARLGENFQLDLSSLTLQGVKKIALLLNSQGSSLDQIRQQMDRLPEAERQFLVQKFFKLDGSEPDDRALPLDQRFNRLYSNTLKSRLTHPLYPELLELRSEREYLEHGAQTHKILIPLYVYQNWRSSFHDPPRHIQDFTLSRLRLDHLYQGTS